MKSLPPIFLGLAALGAALSPQPVSGAEKQRIDMGDGIVIEVDDREVKVDGGAAKGSYSQSVSSQTDGSGNTVATVLIERDGRRISRQITIAPDGRITVANPALGEPGSGEKSHPPDQGGWLGVHSIPIPDLLRSQLPPQITGGVVVEIVAGGSPAKRAGLAPNDILLSVDGAPIQGVESFRELLRNNAPGAAVVLRRLRQGKSDEVTATLASRPAASDAGAGAAVEHQNGGGAPRFEQNSRTVLIGPDGRVKVLGDGDGASDPFDLLLKNPDIPGNMKEQIKKTREILREGEEAGKPKP